jgi:hypothetical protein
MAASSKQIIFALTVSILGGASCQLSNAFSPLEIEIK